MSDAYDSILRSLESGVSLTVNDNTPNSVTWGIMNVRFSYDGKTKVGLTDGLQEFEIQRRNDDIVIGKVTENGLKRTRSVETIEVLGIHE